MNIGEGPSVLPIYRCAEITEVVETVKIYDLGSTRTNVGLKLRIGKSVTTFRLIFVSNQDFLTAEFESWRRRVVTDGTQLPKLSFIDDKSRQIKEYSNFSINDEETMKRVLQSKQRFQKGPVNFAMRKAELTRLKLSAENDGDADQANKYQDEIDELNLKAEKLERKRTTGIKNISYINQRNREITQNHVEKAIELEIEENREWEKRGGDPFLREPTKPVLNYRKKKQQMIEKAAQDAIDEQNAAAAAAGAGAGAVLLQDDSDATATQLHRRSDAASASASAADAKININKIHNFELILDIKDDHHHGSGGGGGHHVAESVIAAAAVPATITGVDSSLDIAESIMSAINNSLGNSAAIGAAGAASSSSSSSSINNSNNSQSSASRRVLNLQDYKRRKGLI